MSINAANTVQRLLAKFGCAVTVTRNATGAYDPATSGASVRGTAQSGVGVLSDYAARDIDGTMILRSDKKLLLSAQGIVEPTPADTLSLPDPVSGRPVIYSIVNVRVVAPANSPLMYEVQVRK
jgi:hypothetical protein